MAVLSKIPSPLLMAASLPVNRIGCKNITSHYLRIQKSCLNTLYCLPFIQAYSVDGFLINLVDFCFFSLHAFLSNCMIESYKILSEYILVSCRFPCITYLFFADLIFFCLRFLMFKPFKFSEG